jgi:hypothetical protein
MQPLDYPSCIIKLYESEANGEAIYLALLRAAKSERDRYHFATLLQLEAETKARLQPFLLKYGVEPSAPDIRAFVEGAVALYLTQGWKALMAASRPIAAKGVAEFEAIAALGPSEDAEILGSMVRHERAILQWIDGELAGSADDTLSRIREELVYPIAPERAADG